MKIQSTNYFQPSPSLSRSLPKVESQQLPQDKLTLVEPPPPGYNPNAPVPGGKYILGAVAAVAAGALGAYAGLNSGTGAVLAGVAAGAVTGGVGLGVVGIMSDIASLGGTNNATKAAVVGAGVGGVAGGLIGSFVNHPIAAIGLGGLAAVAGGFAATAIADEYLPK